MKFRLYYEGQLKSASVDPQDGQNDRRGAHKHAIRRALHGQLKHLWQTNKFLHEATVDRHLFKTSETNDRPLIDVVAETHSLHGFRWVPLVCKEYTLLCQIDVLMMRRDKPGSILQSRDIDNRLKVLFDALKMPRLIGELDGALPQQGEDPFFVLLQDDSLITHVSVETDELLDPPQEAGKDDSYVRLLLTVTLTPYNTTYFNLGFA